MVKSITVVIDNCGEQQEFEVDVETRLESLLTHELRAALHDGKVIPTDRKSRRTYGEGAELHRDAYIELDWLEERGFCWDGTPRKGKLLLHKGLFSSLSRDILGSACGELAIRHQPSFVQENPDGPCFYEGNLYEQNPGKFSYCPICFPEQYSQ